MITHPVLSRLAAAGVKLGLDRVRQLLTLLGEPHRAYPVVHIGGTNGKGSVSMYVTSALVEAGYRVGTNLSPHVEHVNERVRINGTPIDDASLVDAIEALDRALLDWGEYGGEGMHQLTYFEFVTVLAMWVFAQRAVHVAVFEVGLGGRLDATNVVDPTVTAITSIDFDHMAELGDTLAKIAREKAGIFKPRVPVVIGHLEPEARAVVEERAEMLSCPLWRPGKDLYREKRGERWTLTTPVGALRDVQLGLQGEHQGGNALVALGVLHQLRRQGFLVPDEAIRAGFANTRLEGRLEELEPGLLIDGAHNPAGTRALARFLQSRPRPDSRILLFGMGMERDPVAVLQPLLPHIDEVVTTRCAHPKARDPMELAKALQDLDVLLSVGGPIDEILAEVYAEASETIVAGSLYLAGAARSLVRAGVLEGIEPGQGLDDGEE